MLPVIPLALAAAGTGLIAYEALRKKPAAGASPSPTSPATPGAPGPGGAPTMPAELRAAYNQLLAAGDDVDPAQLDMVAAQLAQYGFTAEAAKLRAKAADIRARKAQPGNLPVVPPPTPSLPNLPVMPSAPVAPGQTALVTTSSDPLTLRDTPNGNAIGSLPKGAVVTVLNWNGGAATSNAPQGWAMVTYSGSTGFASKQYLQLGGSGAPAPAPVAPPAPGGGFQTAVVTTANEPLTLRDAPNGGAVGALPKGARVSVVNWNAGAPTSNSSQGWAQVSYNGLAGYASKNYLALQSVVTSGSLPQATDGHGRPVTCLAPEGCRIRVSPSPNGKALAVLPNGETARLVRHVAGAKGSAASPGPGGWCLVRWANFQGWVPSEWMRLS